LLRPTQSGGKERTRKKKRGGQSKKKTGQSNPYDPFQGISGTRRNSFKSGEIPKKHWGDSTEGRGAFVRKNAPIEIFQSTCPSPGGERWEGTRRFNTREVQEGNKDFTRKGAEAMKMAPKKN